MPCIGESPTAGGCFGATLGAGAERVHWDSGRVRARRWGEARSVCQGATEDKLESLGYALPPASTPKGSYAMYSRAGDMLFLAGHIPVRPDGAICTGVVGRDLKKAQGTDAARLCGLAPSYHHHVVTEFEGIGREADDGHAWA